MKKNYTHMILILDRSGSMFGTKAATIEGVNSLVRKQKAEPGDFTTAVYLFNTHTSEVSSFVELDEKNYSPDGGTALLDAFCQAIDREGVRLSSLKESERPDKVVVVVVTDGEENSSHQFKLEDVKKRLTEQETKYAWQFVFLGANIDAFSTGTTMNFSYNNTMQYQPTARGVQASYAAVSSTLSSYRSGAFNSMDIQTTIKNEQEQETPVTTP